MCPTLTKRPHAYLNGSYNAAGLTDWTQRPHVQTIIIAIIIQRVCIIISSMEELLRPESDRYKM